MKAEMLSSTAHKTLRIDLSGPIPENKIQRNSTVVLQEFAHLILQYPIVMTKNQSTGRFSCVAMFGFDEAENLFVERGVWQAVYLPLNIQRGPLMIGSQQAASVTDGTEQVVFVDVDDERVQHERGKALFNERGFPTEYLQHGTALLKAMNDGLEQTQVFIEQLLALELVAPAEINVEFIDKSKRQINGLYTIDRKRLQNLSSAEVSMLHESGYLQPIYTMLTSFGHIHSLIARKNSRLQSSKFM